MLETGLWVPGGSRQSVLARLELDYRRELHYPGDVRVGMNVLSVGGSSFTLGIGLFDGDSCAATMTTLMVRIDMHSRQSVPLDDDERAALQPYRVDQPAYVIASDGFGSHPNG